MHGPSVYVLLLSDEVQAVTTRDADAQQPALRDPVVSAIVLLARLPCVTGMEWILPSGEFTFMRLRDIRSRERCALHSWGTFFFLISGNACSAN